MSIFKFFIIFLFLIISSSLFGADIFRLYKDKIQIQCDANFIRNDGSLNYCQEIHTVLFSDLEIGSGKSTNAFNWDCPVTGNGHFFFRTLTSAQNNAGMINGVFHKLKELGNVASDVKVLVDNEQDHNIPINIIKAPNNKNNHVEKKDGIDEDIQFKIDLARALKKPSPGSERGSKELSVQDIIKGEETIKKWKEKRGRK